MITDKLETAITKLEEIQTSLSKIKNIFAKRAISDVLSDLDDVYNELTSTEYHEQQQSAHEKAEEIKRNAIDEIISYLEHKEQDTYSSFWQDIETIESLARFDGYLFLDTYLAELTKTATYPLDKIQTRNYIWELIAVDIAKRNQGRKNLLDLWTGKGSYSRYMMVQECCHKEVAK